MCDFLQFERNWGGNSNDNQSAGLIIIIRLTVSWQWPHWLDICWFKKKNLIQDLMMPFWMERQRLDIDQFVSQHNVDHFSRFERNWMKLNWSWNCSNRWSLWKRECAGIRFPWPPSLKFYSRQLVMNLSRMIQVCIASFHIYIVHQPFVSTGFFYPFIIEYLLHFTINSSTISQRSRILNGCCAYCTLLLAVIDYLWLCFPWLYWLSPESCWYLLFMLT